MLENGEFQSLIDLPPEEYYGCVITLNENRRNALKHEFTSFPLDPNSQALIIVGSDGKSERHTQSKTELVLLTTNEDDRTAADLVRWYKEKYGREYGELFDIPPNVGLPETKKIGDSAAPLSYAFKDENLIYPDRTLNAQFLLGNEELLQQARLLVLEEATGSDSVGRKIRNGLKQQTRNSLKGLDSGEYRHSTLFTLDPPEQYYNEDTQQYSTGFKVPGLRSIQRMTDLLTINAITAGKLTASEASSFSTNTVERIEKLSKKGLTPDISEVVPAYEWYLQQYHIAQDRYKATRTGIKMPFRRDDFIQHRQAIKNFREAMITQK